MKLGVSVVATAALALLLAGCGSNAGWYSGQEVEDTPDAGDAADGNAAPVAPMPVEGPPHALHGHGLPTCQDLNAQHVALPSVSTCCGGPGGARLCNCLLSDGGVDCRDAPAFCECAGGTVCENQYPGRDGIAFCQ
jgi:hypothetical protein